jgi:hypothetical protein
MTVTRVGPPLGVWALRDRTGHADDESQARGGLVYDVEVDCDGEVFVKTVCIWRGQVEYERMPYADTHPGAGGEFVFPADVRDVLLGLNRDETRRKDPLAHLSAKTILAGVLDRAGGGKPSKARTR